jgi:hypothetical protein
MLSRPIGYAPINFKHERIVNHSPLKEIDGHTSWKTSFGDILVELAGH